MAECPRASCFWPDVGCDLGHLDHSHCPAVKADSTAKHDDRPPPDAVAMPWSGGVLGLADLGFIAGRNKPIVLLFIPSFYYQMTPKISLNIRCSISISKNLSINGRTRSSGQLGIWSYNINP